MKPAEVPSNPVTLEHLLQAMTNLAQHHSSGQFTLSLEHARQKLSRYLLTSSQEYVLKLVQMGVALGASRMDLEIGPGSTRFRAAGCSLPAAGLERLLEHLLEPPSFQAEARALRHLTIAVNTALLEQPQGLRIYTWDGDRGQQFDWSHEGYQTIAWTPSEPIPQVIFEMRLLKIQRLSRWWKWLNQKLTLTRQFWTHPLESLLQSRAVWCPIPLFVEGRPLARPQVGPQDPLYQQEAFRAIFDRTLWITGEGVRCFDADQLFAQPCGGWIVLGTPTGLADINSEVCWVLDGVLAGRYNIPGHPGGGFRWLLLSAPATSGDLTGLQIVSDDALKNRLEEALDWLRDQQRRGNPSFLCRD